MATRKLSIGIKRAYEKPATTDGTRVLVDRLWPRGLSKEKAKIDLWMKDVAPSTELRKWFDHIPEKFDEFAVRYRKELADKKPLLQELQKIAADRPLTLIYGAKDEDCNHAIVLLRALQTNK